MFPVTLIHDKARQLGLEYLVKDFIDVIALTRNAGLDPKSAAYRQLFDQFGTTDLYERVLQRLG